jgi:hypothetical protein
VKSIGDAAATTEAITGWAKGARELRPRLVGGDGVRMGRCHWHCVRVHNYEQGVHSCDTGTRAWEREHARAYRDHSFRRGRQLTTRLVAPASCQKTVGDPRTWLRAHEKECVLEASSTQFSLGTAAEPCGTEGELQKSTRTGARS